MSKQGKIFLGVLSFLPLVLITIYCLMFLNVFTTSFSQTTQKNGPPVFVLNGWNELLVTIALFIVLTLGLLIYYINHAISNAKIEGSDRILWVLAFLLTGIVAYPIYWYTKIWKRPTAVGQAHYS